jgi:EmrB/QacA subfamily drug resistance transporter
LPPAQRVILFTLALGQFLMALDSSVMNVSIATVAEDIGTTITGVQTAITMYTLVMAAFMITGSKIGARMGRKRAFAVGAVIYACGSFTTAISPSLPVLLFGWSFLEGIGACLIMPAIVALVAGNFPVERRPAAYGLIAAAAAIAIAVGPIIGGFATTYLSWRWVFAGEVVLVALILFLSRRIADAPPDRKPELDYVGSVLSALGMGLMVYGVLRSAEWGWVEPKPDGPSWFGLSPTVWLVAAGFFGIWLFLRWESRLESRNGEPLLSPAMLKNSQLAGGLILFFFMFLIQMGVFFTVPLYLSVVLGLDALETGVRLVPLSITLLGAAVLIPRLLPNVSPRLVVQLGVLCMVAGALVLVGSLEVDSGEEVVAIPMLLVGLGIGAMASQLGAVTVSAVPDEKSPEVGGLQNTATQFGASLGTALAGSILFASLTTAFLQNIDNNPDIPDDVVSQADVELASGVPFLSDDQLEEALTNAGVEQDAQSAITQAYEEARIEGLRLALAGLALMGLISLFFSGLLPTRQPAAGPGPPA